MLCAEQGKGGGDKKKWTSDVRDTGIGIREAKLGGIFGPFVQAERERRPPDQGVGLGLAISRKLARAMGGDLRVASTIGEGATFTLTLPRCPV